MRVFIVRPFNTQRGTDFEAVESKLIRPALERLAWKGVTTGEFVHAGDIKNEMMQHHFVGHQSEGGPWQM